VQFGINDIKLHLSVVIIILIVLSLPAYCCCANIVAGKLTFSFSELINRIIDYPLAYPSVALVDNQKFLLPASCRFLISDIQHMQPLLNGQLFMFNSVFDFWSFFITLSVLIQWRRRNSSRVATVAPRVVLKAARCE
jgi:hypothetical protein